MQKMASGFLILLLILHKLILGRLLALVRFCMFKISHIGLMNSDYSDKISRDDIRRLL